MLAGLIFILIMFALANFYYFVFTNKSNVWERFALVFIVTVAISFIVSLISDYDMLTENIVTLSGYYIILFLVHLLIIEVIKVSKYLVYILIFLLMAFFMTVFFTTLMQEIFKYS